MEKTKKQKLAIVVSPRSVLGKKGKIYDAHAYVAWGDKAHMQDRFDFTADSRKEAIEGLLRDIETVRETTVAVYDRTGVCLFCDGYRKWYFRFAHGGGMSFGADGFAAALAIVEEGYKDHPACQGFFTEYKVMAGPEFQAQRGEIFKRYRALHVSESGLGGSETLQP